VNTAEPSWMFTTIRRQTRARLVVPFLAIMVHAVLNISPILRFWLKCSDNKKPARFLWWCLWEQDNNKGRSKPKTNGGRSQSNQIFGASWFVRLRKSVPSAETLKWHFTLCNCDLLTKVRRYSMCVPNAGTLFSKCMSFISRYKYSLNT